jgi:hypothetical protein
MDEAIRASLLGLRYQNGIAFDPRLDGLAQEAQRRGIKVQSHDAWYVYVIGFQSSVLDALRRPPKCSGVRVSLVSWADDREI